MWASSYSISLEFTRIGFWKWLYIFAVLAYSAVHTRTKIKNKWLWWKNVVRWITRALMLRRLHVAQLFLKSIMNIEALHLNSNVFLLGYVPKGCTWRETVNFGMVEKVDEICFLELPTHDPKMIFGWTTYIARAPLFFLHWRCNYTYHLYFVCKNIFRII